MIIYFLKYHKKYRPTDKEEKDLFEFEHLLWQFSEFAKPYLVKEDGYIDEHGGNVFFYVFDSLNSWETCKEEYGNWLICTNVLEEFLEFKEESVFIGERDFYFEEGPKYS